MEQRKLIFYAITALCACVGIVVGAFSSRKIVSAHKETMRIERGTQVREWPSELAEITSLNKNDRLEVISLADYTAKNKNIPTIVKVNNQLKVIAKDTKQQYIIKEESYLKVVNKNKHSYTIEAQTNKGNTVKLELDAKDVTPLEEGLWKHVKDKTGYMGWIKVK